MRKLLRALAQCIRPQELALRRSQEARLKPSPLVPLDYTDLCGYLPLNAGWLPRSINTTSLKPRCVFLGNQGLDGYAGLVHHVHSKEKLGLNCRTTAKTVI